MTITDKQVEAAFHAYRSWQGWYFGGEGLDRAKIRAALEAAEAAREPADYPNPGAHTPLRLAVTEQEPAALGEMTPADIEACVRENQIIRAELYAQGHAEFDQDGTLIPTDEMVRRAMSKPAAQGEAVAEVVPVLSGRFTTGVRILANAEELAKLPVGTKLYTTPQPSAPGVVSDAMVEAACHFYHDPNNWLLLTESARQNYRAMMRGAIDLAISAAPGAQPSADDAPRDGSDPHEFGAGIVQSPGARYWQKSSAQWMARAVALGWREHREACQEAGINPDAAPPADARDAEDARRYRWLRDHASNARGEQPMVHMTDEDGCAIDRPGVVCPITDSSLDAAIDRAIGGES